MKKMKGLLGVIIAVLIIFPFAIVNAEEISAVNVKVALPAVGTEVTYNSASYTWSPSPTLTNNGSGYTAAISPFMTKSSLNINWGVDPEPEFFTGVVTANTKYYFEFEVRPTTGNTLNLTASSIKINGSSTGVEVGTCDAASCMVYGSITTTSSTEENEKVKVSFENTKLIYPGARQENKEIEKGSKVTKPVIEDDDYDYDYIFEGWFADAEFKNAFDFDSTINKDTTIYAKFTKIADLEKTIKDKLDAANLYYESNLTEMEGLEKAKKEDPLVLERKGTVPTTINDNLIITNYRWNTNLNNSSEGYIEIEYTYTYTLNGVQLTFNDDFNYTVKIKYSDSDKHDKELDESVKDLNNKGYVWIEGLLDYSKIPSEDYTGKLLTEKELYALYDESIKKLNGVNNFDVDTYNVDKNIGSFNAWMDAYNALVKNNQVYGTFVGSVWTTFYVLVDPSVDNTNEAYFNNVKDKIKAYFESKGYTNIDVTADDSYGRIFVYYGEKNNEGEYFSEPIIINMMKDTNTYLIAKNLTVNYNDKNLYYVDALSYSENKDNMGDDIIADIESMKLSLELEGYDFFDAYDVDAYITPGNKATLVFTVGAQNNNRRFKVLHTLADGTVETFTGIVKDGQLSIDITETSPFAVGLGEVVKALKNNPQTFDPIILSVLMLALSAIGLIGGSIYLTKSRLN